MKECFVTSAGPRAVGPYSTAVVDGDRVYLSGVIPVDPETGKLVEGGIEAQARRVLVSISLILGELGLTMAHAVKTTVLVTDLKNFGAVNAIYSEYFGPDNYPARSCFEVSALPMGAEIEIEVIATKTI